MAGHWPTNRSPSCCVDPVAILAGVRIIRDVSSARSMTSSRASRFSGLRRYSKAPSRMASIAVDAVPWPVIRITGTRQSIACKFWSNCRPVPSGSRISVITASGGDARKISIASAVDRAVSSSTAPVGNAYRKQFRISSSSSTTSSFGIITFRQHKSCQ